jgi:ribose transport system substrate-binding protein
MISNRQMRRALVALAATALLGVAGCDPGSDTTTTGTAPGGGEIDPAAQLAKAKTATEAGLKGTNRPVEATPRPAVKGKKLAVITSSMAVDSSKVPAQGVEEAAKAIGWDVIVYDAALNPANYPGLVRQATAAGADGIVLVAVDCQTSKQPLEEAKAKGVAVTSVYAYDCNDPRAGNVSEPLFAANTNFGPEATDIVAFTKKYGADQANYIIAESNNAAKVIMVNAPEFTVLNYTADGFKETIEQSGGSEIVSVLEVTQQDIATQQLKSKIDAELLKHPEATWIKSPFTYVTTLGIAPALGAQAGKLKVMGGEGFNDELELMRQGKVTAVNVISSTWNGWAAVDTLNSYWSQKKPADSGIGWQLVDKDHGLPPAGPLEPKIDYKGTYRKAWGVS